MHRYARVFRGWRRSRPFWGGLFTIVAGLEIFATTQLSLGGVTLQLGPTGFLSWLIPTILVTCGVLLWSTPQHRMFYAVVAAVTAVFSLIGVNLGGFLVGLVLGLVGSALGFAWAPAAVGAAADAPTEALPVPAAEETTVDSLAQRRTRLLAVTLILLSVAAIAPVPARRAGAAYAPPCPDTPATGAPCHPGPGPSDEQGYRLAAPADIQPISKALARMTGTKQSLWSLRYVGVTALPVRGGGTMDVLWFEMSRSTTDGLELHSLVPGGRAKSIKSSALTVDGNVRFFTPRFTGKLLGLRQVYTPQSPPLLSGVRTPLVPMVFTDVDIELAYLGCDKVSAPDLLNAASR